MTGSLQDVRYALRQILRAPGFSAATVTTLALGIGVTTTLFIAVDALLLRPLPIDEPREVVEVRPVISEESRIREIARLSYPQFDALRQTDAFASLAGWAATPADVDVGEITVTARVGFVTGDFFPLLGTRPSVGRMIAAADDRRGEPGGVVLGHRLWRSRFSGDPAVVGATLRINGHAVPIIGVAPPELSGLTIGEPADLWAPWALHEQVVPNSGAYGSMMFAIQAVARLVPGTSREAAEERAGASAAASAEQIGGPIRLAGVELRPLSRLTPEWEAAIGRFLTLLAATALLVLLIAAVNVGGMLLVRGAGRSREFGVRSAIGASRRRIVRQLLTEGLVLVGLGTLAGLFLAIWLTDLVAAFRWPFEVTLDAGFNVRVLLFAAGLAAMTGLVCSLLPAWHAGRSDLRAVMAGQSGRGTPASEGLPRLFVVAQVAMTVVLLAAAGLFLRSLHRALDTDPGFSPANVLIAQLDLQRQRLGADREAMLHARILEQLREVPGVRSASLSAAVPLGYGGEMILLSPVGGEKAERMTVSNVVSPDYLSTLGVRLLSGRFLDGRDHADAPRVVVVSQAAAREFWPGRDPIGQRLQKDWSAMEMLAGLAAGDPVSFEVVGVVADGVHRSLLDTPEPYVYFPLAQEHRSRVVVAVRADPAAALPAVAEGVRERVHSLDGSLPLLEAVPLKRLIADQIVTQRIGAAVTSAFGALGLLLAALGLYGVLAFSVTRRTREIGIRMALGAGSGRVVGDVLRGAGALVMLGTGLGLAAALLLTRFLESFLFGVMPTDHLALLGATLVLLGVAGAAASIPARRAARVDPMVALRAD